MARRVLIIAYYFPPMGMGGVQRMTKLAKYLPQFGYDVTVLTVKPIKYAAYDESLLDELPAEVEISRSGSRDPARIARLLPFSINPGAGFSSAVKHKGGLWPDSKVGWKKPAIKLAEKIIREQNVDLILSSSPPVTGHLVALEMKRRHGLPWVADFRDVWETRPPEKLYDDPRLIDKSNRLLDQITEAADMVTAINETMGARLSDQAKHIMGGYDIDDFADLTSFENRDKFILSYMGAVGPFHRLEPWFEAARAAAAADPAFAPGITFKIIGANDSRRIMATAEKFGFDRRVELTGYLPHRQALREASSAAVSTLSVPDGYPATLPGKMFDLIALPLPILAVAQEGGEVARFIDKYNAGICVKPDSPVLLAEAMLQLFKSFRAGGTWVKEDISGFTRYHAAGQFARLMDGLFHE